jgi:outer membrane protein assembly factor BamB
VELTPGGSAAFKVRLFNAAGELVQEDVKAEWKLPVPPLPPGAQSPPPALEGEIADGKLTVSKKPSQQGYVQATAMGITGRARVRVAPQLGYVQDFEKVPPGAVPGGWVNAQGKFQVADLAGGKVLKKVNNNSNPLVARANAYLTLPTARDYTIQADVMGVRKNQKLPDIGLVNSRYTLLLDGKEAEGMPTELRIVSWEALPRVNVAVPVGWKADTWYTVKLQVVVAGGKAAVRGKLWPRGGPEPEKWTIEYLDSTPNAEGSAALYGYISDILPDRPGAEIYYDNVSIKPNK